MKLLKDIIYKIGIIEVVGSTHLTIEKICFDSRTIEKSSLFIAVSGTQVDGHQYIDKAIEDGVIAVVCEILPSQFKENVTYVRVADSSLALGIIAANFYDNPATEIKLIGIKIIKDDIYIMDEQSVISKSILTTKYY